MPTTPDRINYGMSRKMSDGDFGSVDVHFSYSTDVEEDETLDDAKSRCVKYVEDFIVEKISEIAKELE